MHYMHNEEKSHEIFGPGIGAPSSGERGPPERMRRDAPHAHSDLKDDTIPGV